MAYSHLHTASIAYCAGEVSYKINDFVGYMTFKRKIYDKFLLWKEESGGKTALLVEGARRIGKSTIVEEFAKNEYKSYILSSLGQRSPIRSLDCV